MEEISCVKYINVFHEIGWDTAAKQVGFKLVEDTSGFRGRRGFLGIAVKLEVQSNWQDFN